MYMNAAFDNICFKGSVVSQSARFVYLCLCKHADNTNQTCFPSLNRIAEIVGRSLSTIKRAIRELCKYGAIEKTPRFRKDGGQTSNLYKIRECNIEQVMIDEPKADYMHTEQEENALELQQENISFSVSLEDRPAEECSRQRNENNPIGREVSISEKCTEFNRNICTQTILDDLLYIGQYDRSKDVEQKKNLYLQIKNKFNLWAKNLNKKLGITQCKNLVVNDLGGDHG